MRLKSSKLLEDVRDAAVFILQIASGKTLEQNKNDRVFRQAIEGNFEIIGEAFNRLSKVDSDTLAAISDHQRIISFRNVLIHGYDAISPERVWDAIQHHLPKLLKDVETLLSGVRS